jgi:hypothetical protein
MGTVIELKRMKATITAKDLLENKLPALRDDLDAKREAVKTAEKNFACAWYVKTRNTRMQEAEHRLPRALAKINELKEFEKAKCDAQKAERKRAARDALRLCGNKKCAEHVKEVKAWNKKHPALLTNRPKKRQVN